jgi:hypothetical protein
MTQQETLELKKLFYSIEQQLLEFRKGQIDEQLYNSSVEEHVCQCQQPSKDEETLQIIRDGLGAVIEGQKQVLESIRLCMELVKNQSKVTFPATSISDVMINESTQDEEPVETVEVKIKPKRKYTRHTEIKKPEFPKSEIGGTVFKQFEPLNLGSTISLEGNSVDLPHEGPSFNSLRDSFKQSPLGVLN